METPNPTPAATPTATPAPTPTAAEERDAGALAELDDLLGSDDAGDEPDGDAGDAVTEEAPADDAADDADEDAAAAEADGAGDDNGAEAGEDAAAGDAAVEEETPAAAETPAKPEPDAQAAEQQRQEAEAHQQRVTAFQTDYAKLQTLFAKNEFDAYEHAPLATKTLMAGLELVAAQVNEVQQFTQQARVAREEESYWTNTFAKNPENAGIPHAKARSMLAEEIEKVRAEYPDADPKAVQIAATRAWNGRLKTIRGQIKAKTTGPAGVGKGGAAAPAKPFVRRPPVTNRGATVTPAPSTTRVPAKPKTTQEKLEEGAYGNLADLA